MLNTLVYSYVTNMEEIQGIREILVTASDGVFTSNISIMVDVMILNNNPPSIFFDGVNSARFVEGSMGPLNIGNYP